MKSVFSFYFCKESEQCDCVSHHTQIFPLYHAFSALMVIFKVSYRCRFAFRSCSFSDDCDVQIQSSVQSCAKNTFKLTALGLIN